MLRGSCLCGGITFEITGNAFGIRKCHCSLCRRASGTGAIAVFPVKGEQFKWISGEDLVQIFQRPSGYGSAFCKVCGSPAPDANRARTRYDVPAGLVEDDPAFRVAEHIYVGSKAAWDAIGDDAEQFDTM